MSQNKTTTLKQNNSDDDEDLTMVQRWKIQDNIENKVPPSTKPDNTNPHK